MRVATAVLVLVVAVATLPLLSTGARADTPPRLEIQVEAGQGDKLVFSPAQIILPSVPIVLNVTVINNSTSPMAHSFSIRDSTGTTRISVWVNTTGARAYANFTVDTATQITYDSQTFTAQLTSGAVKFFCIPHELIGMTGTIVVGGGSTGGTQQNLGVPIQAYWIGLIGLGAMLLWIGITYFLIKTSSRHFRDEREHVRRGLP